MWTPPKKRPFAAGLGPPAVRIGSCRQPQPARREPNRFVPVCTATWRRKLFEYVKKRLVELADSLLKHICDWVLAQSWPARAAILVATLSIVAIAYNPTSALELYQRAVSTVVILTTPPGMAMDSQTKEQLAAISARLSATVQSDLLGINGGPLTPWSAAQAIDALFENANSKVAVNQLISLIKNNETNGCFCWTEVPGTSNGVLVFIGGWVMMAFADLGENVMDSDIMHVLGTQNPQGWWPMFQDRTDGQFASTYSTASIVLGLDRVRSKRMISDTLRSTVNEAITRSVSWLLTTRTTSGRWIPFPNMPISRDNKESDSISGLVLHTLHVAHASGLAALDQSWLSNLPSRPPDASAVEKHYIELNGRIDNFVYVPLPWMLIATADAYANGNFGIGAGRGGGSILR
jgi:hypothetical protein